MRTLTAAVAMIVLAATGSALVPAPVRASDQPAGSSKSGLPLPRFVSLKSDRVNLRQGPGTDYPTAWVYRRAGLPLEVVQEFEGWRQVRDAEGTTGWVLQSFLSSRRTALVLPWEIKPNAAPVRVNLRDDDSDGARAVAIVEAGVVASVVSCNGTWCLVSVDNYRGWIEQKQLWGVYPSEVVR